MKPQWLWVLLLASGVGTVVAQDAKKDVEKMQGTWKVANFEGPDETFAKEFKEKGKMIFKNDKLTIMLGDNKLGEASFKIDPTKKPKHLDVIPDDGPNKGKAFLSIYELEGETLKLYSSDSTEKRPTDFTYKKGEGGSLVTLQREKEKEKDKEKDKEKEKK